MKPSRFLRVLFILYILLAIPSISTAAIFFSEDFDAGIPANWTVVNGNDDEHTWHKVDPGLYNMGSLFTNPSAIVDSNQGGLACSQRPPVMPAAARRP